MLNIIQSGLTEAPECGQVLLILLQLLRENTDYLCEIADADRDKNYARSSDDSTSLIGLLSSVPSCLDMLFTSSAAGQTRGVSWLALL